MSAGGRTSVFASRLLWVDTAKAVCIVSVVAWHVTAYGYLDLTDGSNSGKVWEALGQSMLPVRMPVFFLISGILAAPALKRAWAVSWRKRVWPHLYLYVLWLGIVSLAMALMNSQVIDGPTSVTDFLIAIPFRPGALWYLYALALYFAVAKLVPRRLSAYALVVSAAISVAASVGWLDSLSTVGSVLQNLFFFLLGAQRTGYWLDIAERASVGSAVRYLSLYVAAVGVVYLADARGLPGVFFALSMLGIPTAISISVQISRLAVPVRILGRLGNSTLVIYVTHLPLVIAINQLSDGLIDVNSPSPLLWIYPIVVTLVVVSVSVRAVEPLIRKLAPALLVPPSRGVGRGGASISERFRAFHQRASRDSRERPLS